MGFLDVISDCDSFPQYEYSHDRSWTLAMSQLWRFCLPQDDRVFGLLIPATVARMPWTSDFKLDESSRTVRLCTTGTDVASESATAMTKLLRTAQDEGSFVKLTNWPGEKFPLLGAPYPFAIDRAIAPYFGIVSTGAQLTIFTRSEDRSISAIWVARRGRDKAMYAGMLDNAVGGAVKMGETPFESLLREAQEEIGIDAQASLSGGCISWFNVKDTRSGIGAGLVEPGVQYVYDLELPVETVLHPAEEGIDWLRPLSVNQVKASLERHEFKPSSACVMIDFFVRHGIINAENEKDFAEIVSRLHRKLPLPTTYPLL